VTRKQCRRFACTDRLPLKIEACPIPVRTERVERLRLDDRAARESFGFEPCPKFAFRPESGDVRSGEADVAPEMPGRHQEMDQRISESRPGGRAKLDRLTGRG